MENSVSWRLGKILDDRYKIESVVGIGGMAVVYKAYDQQLNRFVAVKVLRDDVAMDTESRHQFSKEYEAVGKLSHPNIRAVYDVVSSGDTEYIVMEYVDGINLKQYMKKKGMLSWREVLHFSSQIARALGHAHSRGIIHMDIKPQNIMLPKNGTVKIADFGIAQLDEGAHGADMAEEAVGSIHYISPEQARGEPVDARSDIYSLGVVMYEMLTGKLPFDGETVAEVAVQHFSIIPEAPSEINPDIPLELEDITLRAMQPEPDDRYPTAEDMLADLEDFRKSQTAVLNGAAKGELARPVRDEVHVVTKNVPRISKTGELSKEGYVRRRARASRISLLLGFGLVIAFALVLFAFVWQYWLKDIFSDAERITVPSFIGLNLDDVKADETLSELYDFTVEYEPDPINDRGIITKQDPGEGASRMVVSEGIDVKLTVSSGIQLVTLPDDLVNTPFTDVQVRLRELGLNVIVSLVESNSITQNYVVETDPAPGETISSGGTVTLFVSAGPSVTYTNVPDLVGMTKEQAVLALQHEGLVCEESDITYVSSSVELSGRVMWQNYAPNVQVVSGTQVYIQVGTGPTVVAEFGGETNQGQEEAPASDEGTTQQTGTEEPPSAG